MMEDIQGCWSGTSIEVEVSWYDVISMPKVSEVE
jgi:hypothetical protein